MEDIARGYKALNLYVEEISQHYAKYGRYNVHPVRQPTSQARRYLLWLDRHYTILVCKVS
jgi:hypothetical protein